MDYVAALSQDARGRESESGFVLIRVQVETTRPPSHYSALPHRHDFQEILVLQSGHVRYAIDGGQPVDYCAPSVSFVAKGHIHIVEKATGMAGWLVRFTSDFLPADLVSQTWNYEVTLFNQLRANQSLTLQPSDMHDLELMLELIESEYRRPTTFQKQSTLRHLLSALIIRIERIWRDTPGANHQDQSELRICQEFMSLLEHHFSQHHDVQYYADALCIPPFKLSKVLGRILGKPTKQLIEERIVLEAKRRLCYSDLSIKEIAFALGYENLFHLSRTFKHLIGIGPQAFRERRQKIA